MVRNYLIRTDQTHLFKNGTPWAKWFTGFLKRHPNLSIRVAQNFAVCRAKGVTFEISEKWYQGIFDLYLECWPNGNIPPTHI